MKIAHLKCYIRQEHINHGWIQRLTILEVARHPRKRDIYRALAYIALETLEDLAV